MSLKSIFFFKIGVISMLVLFFGLKFPGKGMCVQGGGGRNYTSNE